VFLVLGGGGGAGSVKSAARMVMLFLDSVAKVSTVVVSGVVVRGTVLVMPLATPAVRVTVANMPLFIEEEALMKELLKHGKEVSRLRMIPSGWKSSLMGHVMFHRSGELNLKVAIKVEGHDYNALSVGERDIRPGTAQRKELLSRTLVKQLLRGRTRRVQRGRGVSSRVRRGNRQGQGVSSRLWKRKRRGVQHGEDEEGETSTGQQGEEEEEEEEEEGNEEGEDSVAQQVEEEEEEA